MQLTAPQDRDALGDWIEGQADREQGKRVLADLPKLPRGQGFVWAPHESVLERVKFPAITTYDSSRTPEDGETLPQVKLAPVDLSKLGAMLQKADEGPDADDPRELRARIAELEEQLAGGTAEPDPAAIEEAEKRGYASRCARGHGHRAPGHARRRDHRDDHRLPGRPAAARCKRGARHLYVN
jgi:hypothetical protein